MVSAHVQRRLEAVTPRLSVPPTILHVFYMKFSAGAFVCLPGSESGKLQRKVWSYGANTDSLSKDLLRKSQD